MAGARTVQVAFRFAHHLVQRLDDLAAGMAKETPGVAFTRADAVRVLLERGLADAGLPAPQSGAASRRRNR